jgi:uncharacterized membrane protein
MTFLRFLMILSLVVWVGGLLFFSFVVAPTVFAPGVLPTRHLAGNVVTRSLSALHWVGLISGLVFIVSSMAYCRLAGGSAHAFSPRHILVFLMLLLTLVSQFGISPKMRALRGSMAEIDTVPVNDPGRMQFDALHVWSVRLESGVLLLGLVVTYLTARQFG